MPTGDPMTRIYAAALASLLLGTAVPAIAGAPPTLDSIKQQALASDGYARAIGRLDPDKARAPIDTNSWQLLDTEVRAVSTSDNGPEVDPNERPQYILMTFRAKTDLYVEVANVLKTSVIRQVIKQNEQTVVAADVTPHNTNGTWTVDIEWRSRLPGGSPKSAFANAVVKDSPEDQALQQKAKRIEDERNARAAADAEKQAALNRQADEARKAALANTARQNAEDMEALRATLEPLIGKWIPYTRIDYHPDREPESEYRALKIDRLADNKGTLTLLLGSDAAAPRAQVPFAMDGGSMSFKDENCAVSFRPARDSGRIYMLFGSRVCYSLTQQVAIIPEERDLNTLDMRKAKGVTMLKDGPGSRPLSPRVDGTKLEAADKMSPETVERNRTAPRYDLGTPDKAQR